MYLVQNDMKLEIHTFVMNFNSGDAWWIQRVKITNGHKLKLCLCRMPIFCIRPMADMGSSFLGGLPCDD